MLSGWKPSTSLVTSIAARTNCSSMCLGSCGNVVGGEGARAYYRRLGCGAAPAPQKWPPARPPLTHRQLHQDSVNIRVVIQLLDHLHCHGGDDVIEELGEDTTV